MDIFISCFSSNGTLVWSTFLGGEGYHEGYNIVVDQDNNIYITGSTHNPNYPTANTTFTEYSGATDIVLTSFDPYGKMRWSGYFGGEDNDGATGLVIDSDNNLYITGRTRSHSFPLLHALQNESTQSFLSSFSSDGVLLWSTLIGGPGGHSIIGMAIDSQDILYITGETAVNGFPLMNWFMGYDINENAFVSSHNSDGSLRWSTCIGGSQYDGANSIAVGEDGQPYVIGHTVSQDFPITTNQNRDLFGDQVGFVSIIPDPRIDADRDGMPLSYGMIVASSKEELDYHLLLFLAFSILTSVIIPILVINNPKIKEMNSDDKKSSLKFLNGYLILFSLIMIGLVSFYARFIYYWRGFTDSPGLMLGDIFIGGVIVIQLAVQFIYTKKQLKN